MPAIFQRMEASYGEPKELEMKVTLPQKPHPHPSKVNAHTFWILVSGWVSLLVENIPSPAMFLIVRVPLNFTKFFE